MDKTKRLESLKDALFENLPDKDLARAGGGIPATTSNRQYVTHYHGIMDEEFLDP